jgi:alpha-1,6-mannosyltransferase
MSFDVLGGGELKSAAEDSANADDSANPRQAASPARACIAPSLPRPARIYGWLAVGGIAASLIVMIVASLARASWMGPAMPMPSVGPPFQISSWRISLDTITVCLWLAAVAGGLGVAAGLIAVRRGVRPPVRLLLVTATIVVAILAVLPPVGSTDPLDYMAFGRMMVLGHSPYFMVPWDLMRLHDPIAKSLPTEWDRYTTPYGPAASVEQYVAALLGGTSAARIVFWLKLVNAIAFGLVALVADRLLRADAAARLRAHLLWTVNPLLIWQLIAAAHLDVLAAAAGMLGLVLAAGWSPPAMSGRQRLDRVLAGGALIGLAADIKITFVLFALGLAWALRRSPTAFAAAACGMLAVVLPSYAWFGARAVKSVLSRDNRTTADNFYQLFSKAQHGFLMEHVAGIATVLVVCVAILTLTRLPFRATAHPAIFAALALSIAWLFIWQYQLPSYEAMIVCLLVLVPASWLDWLVLIRLTAATIALMPGNPTPLRTFPLNRIYYYDLTIAVPIVLIGVVGGLVALCLSERRRAARLPTPEPPTIATATTG